MTRRDAEPQPTANAGDGSAVAVQPAVESDTYPTDLREREQWLTWKATDDGRKVPRAPYAHRDQVDRFVSAQDPDMWTGFGEANQWADRLPTHGLAFTIPSRDDRPDDPYVLVDYDDVRDPETGTVHPTVREHLARADSYADVSTSGTGVHIVCRGELPADVKAIDASLPPYDDFPDAELEVYDAARYMVMTGQHIAATPGETRLAQDFLDALVAEYATVPDGTPDELTREPVATRDELAEVETTDDMQDVFDAIQHVRPHDIRLRSTVTQERADGSKSLDPAWTQSKSGTRLAQIDDGWVYRKGMIGLDALQVVALEERIITDERTYPSGDAFWAAVDALRDRGAHIPEYEPGPADGEPVSALPLDRLSAVDTAQRRRLAAKRGLDWPATTEAREQLRARLCEAMRHEEDVVLDAPTGLGKTYAVATEPWLRRADITGDQPVVHLSPTREAREQALEHSRGADGVQAAVLRGRTEACPVAHGIHDPANVEDEADMVPVTMGGQPASDWFDTVCDDREIPFSTAHARLAEHNDQGIELPCSRGDDPCPAIGQWDDIPRTDEGAPTVDVIHATHQFAYVPSLRQACNIVCDERADFSVDDRLTTDRIQRAVTAFLQAADAPVTTWEAFVQLARCAGSDDVHGDVQQEAAATVDAFAYQPAREWYFEHSDAHTLAPALAAAIWQALSGEFDANGRAVGRVPHTPPRLDADASDEASWARTWVTVVVDEANRVRTVRNVPDFSGARSVIGLDAHPSELLWRRNTTPEISVDQVLEPAARRLWRRFERGLEVVQVGDAVRPLASGEYFTERVTTTLLEQLREHYGDRFDSCITASSIEGRVQQLMHEVGIDDPATMHFGEERSRDDFGDRDVGLVHGSIDPGDGYVLDLLAEADLDASPETTETDAGEQRRAHGRGFVGPDADAAASILAAVRETHVAQAAGRYARNADDPDTGATVFVHTSAVPPGVADCRVPGVEWVTTDAQRRLLERLQECGRATAKHLAAELDLSKRYVGELLRRFADRGVVTRRTGKGPYGADVFVAEDVTTTGGADLTAAKITTPGVWGTDTWALAIHPVAVEDVATHRPRDAGEDMHDASLGTFGPEPPPS